MRTTPMSRAPIYGMWLARKAISPSTARQTIISACPEKRVRLGVTSSNWVVATSRSTFPFEAASLLQDALHPAHVEESLLWNLVEVAFDQGLKGFDGLRHRDVDARQTGEGLGHVEGLRQEAL